MRAVHRAELRGLTVKVQSLIWHTTSDGTARPEGTIYETDDAALVENLETLHFVKRLEDEPAHEDPPAAKASRKR